MILGLIAFLLITFVALALRAGWRPSLPGRHSGQNIQPAVGASPSAPAKNYLGKLFGAFLWIAGAAILVIFFWWGASGVYRHFTTPTPAGTTGRVKSNPALSLQRECTTPCSMPMAWEDRLMTARDGAPSCHDGRVPVMVKFHRKSHWLRLPVLEGGPQLTTEQFSPGEAQFASPDRTPVRVQICRKR